MKDIFNFLKKSIKIELVYTTNNAKHHSFVSEIKDIFDDKILISKPQDSDMSFSEIEIFEKFNAVICTDMGVMTSNVNLLKKNHGEFNDVFISFPYNNQFCQRREDTRIPMHIDFELTIPNIGLCAFKSKNISGKGIACLTSEPLYEFSNAEIIIHLPSGDVNASCRKVYSKEILLNGISSYVNGISFTEISPENVNLIVKECLKFQLDSKHNERLFETL